MNSSVFDLKISDQIAHIQLNRPNELNTFTPALWANLPATVQKIDEEADARVIVISSTGKHFTAGMDLSVFSSFEKDSDIETGRANAAFMEMISSLQKTFSALANARLPVIAAVQGGCIGAGLDLVTACDLRLASADAFFSLHEINIGMVADVGTFPRLQKLIPPGIAREMAFTGNPLTADRAEHLGLVNAVFQSPDELIAGAMKTARQIADKSPLAIWGTKAVINYGQDHSVADTLDYVAARQAGMFSPQDIKTALTAQKTKQSTQFDPLAPKKDLK